MGRGNRCRLVLKREYLLFGDEGLSFDEATGVDISVVRYLYNIYTRCEVADGQEDLTICIGGDMFYDSAIEVEEFCPL